MRDCSPVVRVLSVTVLALVVTAASGCKWFRKDNALYAGPPENRPLEVPPDLDHPRTEGAITLPQSVAHSSADAATSSNGFAITAPREEVFTRVARALALVQELTIVNQAELLGTFEVEYGDEQFLVRVSSSDDGSVVSVVDPRGQPATGAFAQRLLAALKETVAQ